MSSITRTFTIPTPSQPLSLTLHEPSLTGDNLGFKTWGSALILAHHLPSLAHQHLTHLLPPLHTAPRVLELGSGTGLVGLAAAALWRTDVVLTDLPVIVPNLEDNARANQDVVEARGGHVSVEELDWADVAPRERAFDVVLAVDPLYSTEHPGLLAPAIDGCLSYKAGARVIVGFPLRDEATRMMGERLKELLGGRGLELLCQGEEYGFDDWEVNGERARVQCWWGIWGREAENTEDEVDGL